MSTHLRGLKFVPNLLTSCSAACGLAATILALDGEKSLIYASYLIFIASIFDFSDGFAARLLHAKSSIGKELDSLADTISFGVAPSAIMYQLLKQSLRIQGPLINQETWKIVILLSVIIIAVFTILRLAKFNVDTEQVYGFKGLASPANAILIASIPLINAMVPEDFWIYTFANHIYGVSFPTGPMVALIGIQVFVFEKWTVLLPIFIVSSSLMLTNIPMFSFKMRSYGFKENAVIYIFLIISLLLLIILQWIAIPIIILLYIIISLCKRPKTF